MQNQAECRELQIWGTWNPQIKSPDLSAYVSQDRLLVYWISNKGKDFLRANANPENSIAVTESSILIDWSYVRSFLEGVDRANLRFRIRGM